MNDPLCHPIPTLPISRPQPRRPHLTHKAIPPPDSILHQPSRSTTRSQCPTAEASGWRQASGAESDDDDMDGNGEDEYGDEGEARGCGWRSDEDSEETHDSSISSRDSRDSAVLMTPPVMVPRLMSDLLTTGPKRKRSITHISSIPIDLIRADALLSLQQSADVRAQRPIRGKKRVTFMLPPPDPRAASSLPFGAHGVPAPVPAQGRELEAVSAADGRLAVDGQEVAGTERRPVSLGALMRLMSMDPGRHDEDPTLRGDVEAVGAGLARMDGSWDVSDEPYIDRAERYDDTGYDSEDSDSDEDDDLIIII